MTTNIPDRLIDYEDPRVNLRLIAPEFIQRVAELEIIEYLAKLDWDRQGSFVDAGAHIGFYSVYMSKLFPKVFAFEPSPFQRGYLERNKSTNDLKNLTISSSALGETRSTAKLYVMGRSGGGNTLCYEASQMGDPMSVIDVDVLDLDSLRDLISPVSIIKIDVEGFEMELLRGAKEIIFEDRPLIVCEVWESEIRRANFEAFLNEICYSCDFPFDNFPEMSICLPK